MNLKKQRKLIHDKFPSWVGYKISETDTDWVITRDNKLGRDQGVKISKVALEEDPVSTITLAYRGFGGR